MGRGHKTAKTYVIYANQRAAGSLKGGGAWHRAGAGSEGGEISFSSTMQFGMVPRQIGVSVFPSEPNGFSRMVP